MADQSVFTGFWKSYSKFLLDSTVAWKRDHALFLIAELTLALLSTLNINSEHYTVTMACENLLACIVLLAHQKRGDFVLQFHCERFEPVNELQRFWAPYINSSERPRAATDIAKDLMFLHARHVENTEVYGTPYICDRDYNKILHTVLRDCLKLLGSLTDRSPREIAAQHMSP
jgi:hypothetical protein